MQKIIIRKRTVLIFLALTGLLAYFNSFNVPFHYDDISFLREKTFIKSFSLFSKWMTENYSSIITGRAFLLFTFYLNYVINGLDTFGYHFVNLLIHVSTAFLFYLLIIRYAGDNSENNKYKAMLAATLFLVHPVNTESVTYISSRSSELSALFILSSMLMFFRATKDKFLFMSYILSLLFFIIGLSAKEAAIVTPLLIVLFDIYFISDKNKTFISRLKYYIPFIFFIAAGFFYYSGYITHPEMYDRPWRTHVLTETKVFAEYIKLLFFPIGLSIDHSIKESVSLDRSVIVSLIISAGFFLTAIFLRKRNKILSFSILWFFVNLMPFLFIRLSDYMTERWLYAASLGFSLGLGELLILLSVKHKKIGITAIICAVISLGMLTHFRNNVYKDPITLWADAASKAPDKIRPYTNLCASYLERGDINKAIETCNIAIKKGSDFDESYINLASAYFFKSDFDKAEAILLSRSNNTAIEIYHYNLGVIYKAKKEYKKAIEEYKKVLKIHPRSTAAFASIGECYSSMNMKDKADEYFLLATKTIPQNGEDYLRFAQSYFMLGEKEKGTENLSKALITEPLNLNIRNTIAALYFNKKNYDEAYRHYSIMAKISPNLATAYDGMGRAMLAKGEKRKAKKYFEKALSLLPADSSDKKQIEELILKSQN